MSSCSEILNSIDAIEVIKTVIKNEGGYAAWGPTYRGIDFCSGVGGSEGTKTKALRAKVKQWAKDNNCIFGGSRNDKGLDCCQSKNRNGCESNGCTGKFITGISDEEIYAIYIENFFDTHKEWKELKCFAVACHIFEAAIHGGLASYTYNAAFRAVGMDRRKHTTKQMVDAYNQIASSKGCLEAVKLISDQRVKDCVFDTKKDMIGAFMNRVNKTNALIGCDYRSPIPDGYAFTCQVYEWLNVGSNWFLQHLGK